jgi:3-phosphoshikimate 1-carboxyvinyltransferase
MRFKVNPSNVHDATTAVPGDKSISHRAIMLGGIANGRSDISGFLAGEDCLATLAAMAQMGVEIERRGETEVTVHGVGLRGLQGAGQPLDMGNSGTAMRLMTGLLAGQAFDATLTGDASLTGRPMGRVITPLAKMGAEIDSVHGHAPLAIHGKGALRAIHYDMPVASAQVKSAVLLAGLYADGVTSVVEPAVTRDHTERMLETMGVVVERVDGRIGVAGGQALKGCSIQVPGDLSSAAFVILAGLLSNDAELLIENVGVNPTRTGVLDILRSMGAEIELQNPRLLAQEPVADVRVRSSELHGISVDPELVSLAIDEFPVLFVAAAAASGTTTFSGIGELRVKESDRIASMSDGLRKMGITVDEFQDGASVHGGQFNAATVASFGDHRIAMAFAASGAPVLIEDVAAVDTSFPGFAGLMRSLGLDIEVLDDDG